MWCRFLTFCVLVSFILFVVASCIYGRPSFHLFFHRCCGDDIENDQVIFENFGNNFLKERLVGGDLIEADNGTIFENEDIGRITDETKEVLSINDPEVKKWIAGSHLSDSAISNAVTEENGDVEQVFSVKKEKDKENYGDVRYHKSRDKELQGISEAANILREPAIEDKKVLQEIYAADLQEKTERNKRGGKNYELLEKTEVTGTINNRKFLNVHDAEHNRLSRTMHLRS